MNPLNALISCSLQVTLVVTFGLLTSLAARRWLRTSAAVPLAATVVSVLILTVCTFSPWPSWLHRPAQGAVAMTTLGTVDFDASIDRDAASFWETLSVLLQLVETKKFPTRDLGTGVSNSTDPSAAFAWSWGQIAGLIFAVGMTMGLARFIGGLCSVRAFIRSSRRVDDPALLEQVDLIRAELRCAKPVAVRESRFLATAAIVGWRRPIVLLSENWRAWTATELRSVLAHEIAHITRGDFVATVAAQLGVVVHFYHPLVHWLVNRLRLEQELAADALAARVVGGSRAYLKAIGELALKQTSEPVGWPAHTFLPTRRTFLRRIEMLRDLKFLSGSAPRALRWATMCSVTAVTMFAIGLRPPGGESSPSTLAAQDKPATTGTDVQNRLKLPEIEALDTRYIPADAFVVASGRPMTLIQLFQRLKDANQLPGDIPNPLEQIGPCTLATAVLVLPPDGIDSPARSIGVCLTYANQEARDAVAKNMLPQTAGRTWQKKKLLLFEYEVLAVDRAPVAHPLEARYMPDDRTLILGSSDVVEKMILAGPKSLSPLTQTESWKNAANGSVSIAVDAAGVQKVMAHAPPNPVMGMFSPLWESAVSHTIGMTIGERTRLTLTSLAKDPAGAQKIDATHRAGMALLSNMLDSVKSRSDATTKKAVESLLPILEGHKIATQGNQTTLTCEADLSGVVATLAGPVAQARAAAQRTQQMNNLKQIMLALHNYHDANGHFPPAIMIDPKTKVPRSWRVEILPYVDAAPLYNQYKMDEPWDSESNKKILAQMPPVFRHPSQPADSKNTCVIAAYGKGLVFEENPNQGTKIGEITDGTSNTIAIIESKTNIPWSKPEDISIDLSKDKLPDFGSDPAGFKPAGFNVGFSDGSVRVIAKTIDVANLKKLLTRAGGEAIDFAF